MASLVPSQAPGQSQDPGLMRDVHQIGLFGIDHELGKGLRQCSEETKVRIVCPAVNSSRVKVLPRAGTKFRNQHLGVKKHIRPDLTIPAEPFVYQSIHRPDALLQFSQGFLRFLKSSHQSRPGSNSPLSLSIYSPPLPLW